MLEEHDRIVLTDDVADPALKPGDVGTIVHIHRNGGALEVEFLTLDGHTAALATVSSSQVRPATGGVSRRPGSIRRSCARRSNLL